MKRMKQLSIWMIAFFAITVTNPAWAAPNPGCGGEITLTSRTMTSLSISWCKASDNNYPEDRLKYRVIWKKKGTTTELNSGEGLVNISSYTITGLEAGTEYEVYIRVWSPGLEMNHYKKKKFKTDPDKVDPTPGKLIVAGVTKNSIALSWTRATDNSTLQSRLRYQINWKKTTESIYSSSHTMNALPVDITSYTITGLNPDTEYNVNVYVRDQAGNGAWYNPLVVRTQSVSDTQAPTAGSYGTITSTTNSITLNWTRGSDDVTPQDKLRYRVRYTEADGSGGLEFPVYTNITTYTITGLQPNTEYKVNVAIWDEADKRTLYGERTIKTKPAADTEGPKAGCNGKVTVKNSTSNSVTISWCKATDNVSPQNKIRYFVGWKKTTDAVWNHHSPFTYDIDTYTLTGLAANTEYDVYVQTKDEADNWGLDYKQIKVSAADTQAPTAGTYSSITSIANSITVNWTRGSDNVTPTNKLKYWVIYETKANYEADEQLYGTTRKTNITTETITGLKPNTEYYIEVNVVDEAGKITGYGPRFIRTKPVVILVDRVVLTSKALEMEVGQTSQLKATVFPLTATNKKVTWSSSNTTVATVDGSGTVKGIAPGTATITVKTVDGSNKTATATVTVKEKTKPTVNVTSVTLNRDQVTVNGDYDEVQLTAIVAPSDATDQSLTWTSDNPQVASVDGAGLVRIHKKGKARITVKANDGSGKSASCLFDVIQTVGNETVDGLRVYAHGGALHLTLPNAATVHIYNVSGMMVKTLFLSAGDHVQPLPEGFYIVRIGERVTKILVK